MAFKMRGPWLKSALKHPGKHPGPGKEGDKGYHTTPPTPGGHPIDVVHDIGVKAEQGDSVSILAQKLMSGKKLTSSDKKYLEQFEKPEE